MPLPGKNTAFLDFVYDFYRRMQDQQIILAYEGEINHQVMKSYTSLAEKNMSGIKEPELIQKKVFHVMVECLQNIAKHAANPDSRNNQIYGNRKGALVLSHNQNEYHVTTGNMIEKSKIPYLKDLLDHINSLSREDLDKLYQNQLKFGHLSDKQGAGLGFIDIRRKTGSELIYRFMPVSETHEFFLFISTIPRKM